MQQPRIWGTLDPFIETGDVMGRKVANAAFLDALLRADPYDAYHFFMPSLRGRDLQQEALGARYPELAGRGKFNFLTRSDLPQALSTTDYAVFHLSDCITSQARLGAARNALAKSIFPITGPTHSLSYAAYGRELLAHLWPGTTRRDAIVATSVAGRAVVAGIFKSLRQGYGLDPKKYPAPTLAHIPLGVDVGSWEPLTGPGREAARVRRGIAPNAVTLLVFGRISHSSKMDLLPLLRAAQRLIAAGDDPAGLCLVVAGWTDDDANIFTETLSNLAANIGLPLRLFQRPSEADKRELFGLADIFVSLADNPQETFGLTLLEAMASGLPVLASDYDGYRDIVVSGKTGFLAPTLGPADTDPRDVLAPLCFDNQTHLLLAQGLAVDVAAVAEGLSRLIRDAGLRLEMGRAGRARARALFTWETVVARHLELWAHLADEPVEDLPRLRQLRHPAALAYGTIFQNYATATLSDAAHLTWSRTGQAVYRGQDFPVVYQGMGQEIMPQALRTLLFLARGGCPADTLAARLEAATPSLTPFAARFHVLWALKQDLLERQEGA
ncbi:MAG: glycosyltransferase family 4 protein [Solidesulfovibrio sp.]